VFREVSMMEIREMLRSWLAVAGPREVAAQAGGGPQDRPLVRRGGGGGRAGP
jgi:hypothetical protein